MGRGTLVTEPGVEKTARCKGVIDYFVPNQKLGRDTAGMKFQTFLLLVRPLDLLQSSQRSLSRHFTIFA